MQWEKRIHKSLNSMCTEIGVSLARFRQASDKDELEEKWSELSTYDIGEYTSRLILEWLASAVGPRLVIGFPMTSLA